jgi:hypothetical protein
VTVLKAGDTSPDLFRLRREMAEKSQKPEQKTVSSSDLETVCDLKGTAETERSV